MYISTKKKLKYLGFILILLGCNNKVPQADWLLKSKNLLFPVLEAHVLLSSRCQQDQPYKGPLPAYTLLTPHCVLTL